MGRRKRREHTSIEPAAATTKTKRTTQTKGASWHTPTVIMAGPRSTRRINRNYLQELDLTVYATSKNPRHQRMRRRERLLVLELALVALQFLLRPRGHLPSAESRKGPSSQRLRRQGIKDPAPDLEAIIRRADAPEGPGGRDFGFS